MTSEQIPQGQSRETIERELTAEEKRQLSDAWVRVVLGRGRPPVGVEQFTNEQLKAWLYDSLIDETLLLRSEWGISPDMEKYRAALDSCENDVQRGNVQFKFIDFFIESLRAKMPKPSAGETPVPTKWESWPKAMRESGTFNCVGATLFSIASMEEAGIEVFEGNPAGHAVAIARLKDGDYVYVDSNNFEVFVIQPEKRDVDGVSCLEIHHPAIVYELIPVSSRENIVHGLLLNMSGIKRDATLGIHKNQREKERTLSLYAADKESLDSVDFKTLRRSLYGVTRDPWNSGTPRFRAESARVGLLHDFFDFLNEKKVSGQLKKELYGLLVNQTEAVEQLMFDLDKNNIPGASSEVIALIEEMHKKVWEAVGDAEVIKKALHWLVENRRSRMRSQSTAS